MSALDEVMDICDCKERRIKRRERDDCARAHVHAWMFTARCRLSKLLSARASAQKDSKFDVCGVVHYQCHGSSSPKAEQPAEL
eukprot:2216706-Pleurochrysis_carterae.AAC.1